MRRYRTIYRRRWLFAAIWILVAACLLTLLLPIGREVVLDTRVGDHAELIEQYAEAHDVDPSLIAAVIRIESSGNPNAVSSAGARGLMQITPITEQEIRERFEIEGDVMDPATNIRMGSRYLAYMLERFDGDRTLALAAYHMGPTRVARLRRENPGLSSQALVDEFAGPQTQHYVQAVLEQVS